MITNYSGVFGNYSLIVRNTFIQIRMEQSGNTLTLHYNEGILPEFKYADEEDSVIFKTPTLWLKIKFNTTDDTIEPTVELLDGLTQKTIVLCHDIPNSLAQGLKDIGENREPQLGIMHDDSYSDSGYTASDEEENASFSDTSY